MSRMAVGGMVRGGAAGGGMLGVLLLAAALALTPSRAQATSFPLASGQRLVGGVSTYVTREEDTLADIARRNDLGYGQLVVVNRDIDPWLPGAGKRVTLPSLYLLPDAPRRGIVINLAEQRLYYFPPDGKSVETYPIGVGVEAGMTPLGVTRVVAKDVDPTWHPPASIRAEEPDLPAAVPPGPNNPLGHYALRLGWNNYLIHGTNKPYGIGRNVSHGCIRLYPEDIRRLFAEVATGTPVRVIDEEIRIAWVSNHLYLAVSATKQQMDELAENKRMSLVMPEDLHRRVRAAAGSLISRVVWRLAEHAGLRRPGMPVLITKP